MGLAMIGRREFIAGVATAVAAPAILREARAAPASLRIRRDVQKMAANDPWFTKYAQAVQAMHDLTKNKPNDQRGWRNQALIHLNHCPHGTKTFVHWHRHYILNFELICGQLIGDPNFALAYWNWSANTGTIPNPFYDLQKLNVTFWKDPSNAQSNNWSPNTVTTKGARALAKGQGLISNPSSGQNFTQTHIDDIKENTDFDLFTSELETGPHNSAHTITGGSSTGTNGHMRSGMSPLDPIFWLHHCNIDRIWAEWQRGGNVTPGLSGNYNNQFVNGAGQQVAQASSQSALDFAAMNYNYDTLSGELLAKLIKEMALERRQWPPGPPPEFRQIVLGGDPVEKVLSPRVTTQFAVDAKELLPNLFRQRTFQAVKAPTVRRLAVGGGRIVAKLSGVKAPGRETSLLCKVFVNHPDANAATPSTDPLYAGTFSFFGAHGGHGLSEIYVDVTRPLRYLAADGRLEPETVSIQIVPVPADGAATDDKFSVGRIELVSV
jgi:tyrosinase